MRGQRGEIRDLVPRLGSLKPYIDAIRPIADKYGIGAFDKAKGDELMTKAGYKKNAAGIWKRTGKPLPATSRRSRSSTRRADRRPAGSRMLASMRASARHPRAAPSCGTVSYDLTLFGHRGSISDPYAHSRCITARMHTKSDGRPLPGPLVERRLRRSSIGDPKMPPNDRAKSWSSSKPQWRSGCARRSRCRSPEWYHRVPMNQTYWVDWPTEQNPYMQPSFWYTSGTSGYVVAKLKPAS